MEQLESVLRSLTSEDRVLLINFLRFLRDIEDNELPLPSSERRDQQTD